MRGRENMNDVLKFICYISITILAYSCVFMGGDSYTDDMLEETNAFLVCKLPKESKLISFSNGFRTFLYDVTYKSPNFSINEYSTELLRRDWMFIDSQDNTLYVYKKDNYIYKISALDNEMWREYIVNVNGSKS